MGVTASSGLGAEIGSSRQTQDPQRWRSIRPHSQMLKSRTAKI
ncbi:conserved protein of unknown function [Xenorhabdus doucetiae]|uniref:Uncharacterized protein n=1 Tax=Xenorhabdus doucetiae TaxID=351671 RepID=A0A068QMI4_9GAMM|nr:conserved protein of unknown function [Xenorhabdus doucetiae]